MVKFKFFVEDEYGDEFFENLINRLKNENLIPRDVVIDARRLPADCNTKIDRAIRSALTFGFDRVVLVIDGDGNPKEKRESAELHIPPEFKDRVDLIVFEYEAEEWLCKSLRIRYGSYTKPSKALNDWLRNNKGREYYKRDLPKFVSDLDLNFLLSQDKEFKNLIKILKLIRN